MGWVEHQLEHVVETVTTESARTRAELAASFAATLRGSRLDGALSRPIRANAQNYGAGGRLVGWSLRATGGDVAVTLHDGSDSNGDTIATLNLPSGTTNTVPLPGAGVSFVDGLFAEVTGVGAISGALWIGAVD